MPDLENNCNDFSFMADDSIDKIKKADKVEK